MISVTVPANFCYSPPLVRVMTEEKPDDKKHDLPDGPLRKRAKFNSPLDGPLKNKVFFIACMKGLL